MKKLLQLLFFFYAFSLFGQDPVFKITFNDNANLLKADIGKDVVLKGTHSVIDGPSSDNKAIQMPKGSYYEVDLSDLPIFQTGNYWGQWSMVMDIRLPEISDGTGGFFALYQTSPDNDNDADCFIHESGDIGTAITGYTPSSLSRKKWYRVAITMDSKTNRFSYYIDGVCDLTGTSGDIASDGRFALQKKLLLFADNDGEDGKIDVAGVMLYDRVLSSKEIADLGNFPVAPVLNVDFNDPANLLKATIGKDLKLVGSHTVTEGPTKDNSAVIIPKGSYYEVDLSNIDGFNSSNYLNVWTAVIDLKLPKERNGLSGYIAVYQTDPANKSDGDCFIDADGKTGTYVTGYTPHNMADNEWYRVVIQMDCMSGKFAYYIDGQEALAGDKNGYITENSRFALQKKLLLFADDDGEDGDLAIAGITLYNAYLSANDIKSLGGFGHRIVQHKKYLLPFLYDPSSTTAKISWHDLDLAAGVVEYGTTEQLGLSATSASRDMTSGYYWHTARLGDLQPNTLYYYRIRGNEDVSDIYTFKTLPAEKDLNRIRFLIMGDSHGNTDRTAVVLDSALNKLRSLYGGNIHNCLDMILHTGDLTDNGNNINDYTRLLFNPFEKLSPYIPMLIVPGNHEMESQYFYDYIASDDISAFPLGNKDFKRYWKKQFRNVLILGLNSYTWAADRGLGERQLAWVKETLNAAESDNKIDMVFILVHECPVSELWAEGMDGYVANDLYPVLRQYSKVQQISYGHTHGYERGASLPVSDNSKQDIALLCDGNIGCYLDRWHNAANNPTDRPEISIALDHWCFIVGEIDLTNRNYTFRTYSLGNDSFSLPSKEVDSWYGNVTQSAPQAPTGLTCSVQDNKWNFTSNSFEGIGSLYSTQFQIIKKSSLGETVILNSLRDVRNIHDVTTNFTPIDKNEDVDILTLQSVIENLDPTCSYLCKVRFRDDNRKWSEWSQPLDLSSVNKTGSVYEKNLSVFCDRDASVIHVVFPYSANWDFGVYDLNGRPMVTRQLKGESGSFGYHKLQGGSYIIAVTDGLNTYRVKVNID
ncbi:MAG: metallophosphoesterase [Bacteroidales bacterium]